ncbi:putative prolyl 4-hydroxylase 7 [Nymphaea thermarum]|nr:putative prolyl 4-hydroxylase 7 [Nymphaea thermarum]
MKFLVLFLLFFCHLDLSQSLDLSGLYRSLVGSQEEDDDPTYGFDPTKVTPVSWRPRAFIYNGFLSNEECDHIIKLAKEDLKKSQVAHEKTGESYLSDVRTSSGTFLKKEQDAIIKRIENRISTWTFLPKENAEPIQVLRYGIGEKYEPHFDYFNDKKNIAWGGHRMVTVLMYLSNVTKGGETVFPNAEASHFTGVIQEKDDTWSDCSRRGLAVKPKKGDAVLFFSLHPDATTDPASLHASCPVIEGEKWSAPCWIHVGDRNTKVEMEDEPIKEKVDLHLTEPSSTKETEKDEL